MLYTLNTINVVKDDNFEVQLEVKVEETKEPFFFSFDKMSEAEEFSFNLSDCGTLVIKDS